MYHQNILTQSVKIFINKMQVKNCTLIKPLYCKKETNVVEVAKILRDNKQRRIIVVDENDYPIGIISTTDINNRFVAENKNSLKSAAKDIMTSPIYLTCDINNDLNEVFKKMVEHQSFFCPVIKDNKLYGVLTYGELIKRVHHQFKNG